MSEDNRSVEIKIRQISSYIDEWKKVFGISSIETQIRISFFDGKSWHGEVSPSIFSVDNKGMIITHSYHAESLEALLLKMLKETKEELDLIKDGKCSGI